jgi:cold-inducible RNA-binding protein
MGRRLYVGNLAWTVTDQDLQDVFSEAGKVESSQVIVDRATNRSRGFGFVEMATDEAADAAIKKLNGRDIKGRAIRVNEAQARSGGGGAGGGGERRGGPRDR